MDKELLKKLNNFTRREHTEDEVYCFSIILCDNEVDRDNERFSLKALNSMKELFVGKTGIFDHNPKGSNQTARIFSTEVISDNTKKTSVGDDYTYLKADAYMVRTSANSDLIKEIDGGIKKEVSVSCNANKKICSVCGVDTRKSKCSHKKGSTYNHKKCFNILDEVTDAYEWSFVAVPAQINAGVTKFYGQDSQNELILKDILSAQNEFYEKVREDLTEDIIRLDFVKNKGVSDKTFGFILERMTIDELYDLKKLLKGNSQTKAVSPQLTAKSKTDTNVSDFKI